MGGNVFEGKTSSIELANINPTLDAYFLELSTIFPKKAEIFSTENFHLIGSAGKKPISGDIDLAVSNVDIFDSAKSSESSKLWNIEPNSVDIETDMLVKRARTSTLQQLRLKAFLKLLARRINQIAPNIRCNEKNITDGNLFTCYPQFTIEGKRLEKYVQIDWMIGNVAWLKFSYFSDSLLSGSNIKGLHRTQLILAAFQLANCTFGHVTGVKDKNTGEIIAADPNTALDVLNQRLDLKIDQQTAHNYYLLHNLLKTNLSIENYNRLLEIYFKILDSTRADIPDDMQPEWLLKKHDLGLTGKFLPNDSKLKE